MAQLTELRRSLGKDTAYTVAKNTLVKRAAADAGVHRARRPVRRPDRGRVHRRRAGRCRQGAARLRQGAPAAGDQGRAARRPHARGRRGHQARRPGVARGAAGQAGRRDEGHPDQGRRSCSTRCPRRSRGSPRRCRRSGSPTANAEPGVTDVRGGRDGRPRPTLRPPKSAADRAAADSATDDGGRGGDRRGRPTEVDRPAPTLRPPRSSHRGDGRRRRPDPTSHRGPVGPTDRLHPTDDPPVTPRTAAGHRSERTPIMAKLSTDELLDAFKELTLIELSEFVKQFEETFGVTAAAPVAVAAAGRSGRCRSGRGRRGAGRVRRHPRGRRREEGPGHQGRPRARLRAGPEGGQGPGRRGPEGRSWRRPPRRPPRPPRPSSRRPAPRPPSSDLHTRSPDGALTPRSTATPPNTAGRFPPDDPRCSASRPLSRRGAGHRGRIFVADPGAGSAAASVPWWRWCRAAVSGSPTATTPGR